MKYTALLAVSLCAATSAFTVTAPTHGAPSSTTSLNAATMGNSPGEGWFGKIMRGNEQKKKQKNWFKKEKKTTKKKSTEPVASRMVSKIDRMMMDDVVIDPDFTLTWAIGVLGPLIAWYHPSYMPDGSPSLLGVFGSCFHILFAALLWVQTSRVRCVFGQDSFEFYNVKGPRLDLENGAWLEKKPDNFETGTVNRWHYDRIMNYGFFPSEEFPVICYFKETETPESQWDKSIAAFDSYGRGQPHFFPGICNVRQFKEQMELRGVKRKPIPTLKGRQSMK